jgi:hypothetical protein
MTWAALALASVSTVLGAAITLLGQRVGNRAATELEARSKREEVMRTLRWAAELAVSNDARESLLGIQELEALRKWERLNAVDEGFIDAALDVTVEGPRQIIQESAGDVRVLFEAGPNAAGETTVPSQEGGQGEEPDI